MSHLNPRLTLGVGQDARPMVEQGKSAQNVAMPRMVESKVEVIDVLSNNLAKLLPLALMLNLNLHNVSVFSLIIHLHVSET